MSYLILGLDKDFCGAEQTFSLINLWLSLGRQRGRGNCGSARDLDLVEECHEAEVHVQLLVAVEESRSGIVGNEVDLTSG
jgi:hypothetical protein